MKPIVFFLVVTFALIQASCEHATQKGKKILEKAERNIQEKKEEIVDKVLPRFDAYTPDTKYNKERFRDFIKMGITSDIRKIYCFGDAIGIDAKYQFAFNCHPSTAAKILALHQLKPAGDTSLNSFGIQRDFDWWDKNKIEKLPLYSWRGDHQSFKYFWYDTAEEKAYFFDFDL